MEYQDLLIKILGLDDDADFDDIDDALFDKHGIDSQVFIKVAELLLPYSHKAKSELTGTVFIGFADHENNCYLVKRMADDEV